MNPLTKIWFWLLILSIIGFIIALIGFETSGQTNTTNTSTPVWIWVVFALSLLFWIIALILYCIDVAAYHRRMEIAEACGELPPSKPKKKIECPKKKCVEKKVIECVEKKPCDKPQKTITIQTDSAALPKISTPSSGSFSAAGLQPLSTLAPTSGSNM